MKKVIQTYKDAEITVWNPQNSNLWDIRIVFNGARIRSECMGNTSEKAIKYAEIMIDSLN